MTTNLEAQPKTKTSTFKALVEAVRKTAENDYEGLKKLGDLVPLLNGKAPNMTVEDIQDVCEMADTFIERARLSNEWTPNEVVKADEKLQRVKRFFGV